MSSLGMMIPPHFADEETLLSDMMDLTTFGLKTGVSASMEDDGVSASRPSFPLPPLPPPPRVKDVDEVLYDQAMEDESEEEEGQFAGNGNYFFPGMTKATKEEEEQREEEPSYPSFEEEYDDMEHEDVKGDEADFFLPHDSFEDMMIQGLDEHENDEAFAEEKSEEEADFQFVNDDQDLLEDISESPIYYGDVAATPGSYLKETHENKNEDDHFFPMKETQDSDDSDDDQDLFPASPTSSSVTIGTKSSGNFVSFSIGPPSSSPSESGYESSGAVLKLGGEGNRHANPTVSTSSTTTLQHYDDPYSNYFHPNHRYPGQPPATAAPPSEPPRRTTLRTYERQTPFTVRLKKTTTTISTTTTTTHSTTPFTARPTSTRPPSPKPPSYSPPAANPPPQTYTIKRPQPPPPPPVSQQHRPGVPFTARPKHHPRSPFKNKPKPTFVRLGNRNKNRPPPPPIRKTQNPHVNLQGQSQTPFTVRPTLSPNRRRFRPYQVQLIELEIFQRAIITFFASISVFQTLTPRAAEEKDFPAAASCPLFFSPCGEEARPSHQEDLHATADKNKQKDCMVKK